MPITGPFRSEWLKGRGRPLDKFTAAVAVSLGVLIPIIMIVASRGNAGMRAAALATLAFPSSVTAAATMLGLIGPVCAAALGANIAGAEYQYGTWPWLLVRSSGRGRLFLAKVVVGAARITLVALAGILTFAIVGALMCALMGSAVTGQPRAAAENPFYSFTLVAGTMAFAGALALLVTLFARSVTVGVLIGAIATPLMMAIRFKETAPWNYFLHLQNVQAYLTGQPTTMLIRMYEFDMSVGASLWILGAELLGIVVTAYLVFRRQEIVY